jgi:hypothetical protein
VHAVRDEYAQHTTLDDRQPVTALTKNEGEPGVDSPGILVKPMSSLFRSEASRASVAVEGDWDGRSSWGRVGGLVHRPGRR